MSWVGACLDTFILLAIYYILTHSHTVIIPLKMSIHVHVSSTFTISHYNTVNYMYIQHPISHPNLRTHHHTISSQYHYHYHYHYHYLGCRYYRAHTPTSQRFLRLCSTVDTSTHGSMYYSARIIYVFPVVVGRAGVCMFYFPALIDE
jgi:hypothetical protein